VEKRDGPDVLLSVIQEVIAHKKVPGIVERRAATRTGNETLGGNSLKISSIRQTRQNDS
jgi:hypothetical protein